MSDQHQLSIKEELLALMHETINHLQNDPEEEFIRRQTKLNTENGIGYLVTNEQFHLWIVKLPGK